jgi:phenylalanyl-tRNA synthetase alpha chain
MELKELKKQALEDLGKIKNSDELENFRLKYLGRSGELTTVLRSLKDLPISQRKKTGQEANKLRTELEEKLLQKKKKLSAYGRSPAGRKTTKLDISAPGIKMTQGHLHPITQILQEIEEIFQSMGFNVIEGPEIETEYYNFDALNVPKDHPARDMQDTFWLKSGNQKLLLRTHTSPMQIRYMEKNKPPFRIIVPGQVFRYEATDASHSHSFYQMEGLMIDKKINVANFKAIIDEFFKKLFSKEIEIRLRPSYFPFVEPGFEIDIKMKEKWLEVMGAGMVHPNVLKAAGHDPREWQGFAFGVGLDRMAMIKYGIDDIRLFYNGDLRFLKQF